MEYPSITTLWATLALKDTNSNHKQITEAFGKMVATWHPSLAPSNEKAVYAEMLHKCFIAYRILIASEMRHIYQQNREQAMQFLETHLSTNEKPLARIVTIDITLEELFRGTTKTANWSKTICCPQCLGFERICMKCCCTGKITVQPSSQGLSYQPCERTEHCPNCKPCSMCRYSKGVSVEDSETISIPASSQPFNDEIILTGRGDQPTKYGYKGNADVRIQLNIVRHPQFGHFGPHLHIIDTLTLKEALIGFKRTIKFPSGTTKIVYYKGFTRRNQTFYLPNRGLLARDTETKKLFTGDFVLLFKLQWPKDLDNSLASALESANSHDNGIDNNSETDDEEELAVDEQPSDNTIMKNWTLYEDPLGIFDN